MKHLIQNGAKINIRDGYGQTSLHIAAQYGHNDIAEFLIQNKAQANVRNKENCTPLHLAAKYGHIYVVKYLIQNKAKVNLRNKENCTPLHLAAHYGNIDIVEFLTQNKARVNARDEYGQTSLHIAAQYGHNDIVEFLTQNKAQASSSNKENSTPLNLAANKGHYGVVKHLIKNRAEVNTARDEYGQTSLHIVKYENQVDQSESSILKVTVIKSIVTPEILYSKHSTKDNLTPEIAVTLSTNREVTFAQYLKANTVFKDPGYFYECKVDKPSLLGAQSNIVFISSSSVETYQCMYNQDKQIYEPHYIGLKYAIFDLIGKNFHYLSKGLKYNEVVFML